MTTFNGKKVLTNAQGMAVYWFAPDTSTKSNCNNSCLKYWPIVPGPAAAGSGVSGTLSVITTNGVKQATYDGHPLYTFAGDSAAGQAKGNDLNEQGGVWYEMEVSGATPAAQPAGGATSTATSGSGGYGY